MQNKIRDLKTENGEILTYQTERKNVKNINLRIRKDGTVHVSANPFVPQSVLDAFVLSRAAFIRRAQETYLRQENAPKIQFFSAEEVKALILMLCRKAHPYYEKRGIPFPEIRFRRMTSRWGSCQPQKGILTFSLQLMYMPTECIEYVVWHEFTHFLRADHSPAFYEELEKVCPAWRACRERMRTNR